MMPPNENYVVDKGAGEICLLLHGNLACAGMWSDVISRLDQHFRCITPDLPEFGASLNHARHDPRLDHLAEHVEMIMNCLAGSQPVNLVVHGIGGLYGLAWAAKYPHRIKRLAILNTRFGSDQQWHLLARLAGISTLRELAWYGLRICRAVTQNKRLWPRKRRGMDFAIAALTRPETGTMAADLYRANPPPAFKNHEQALLRLIRQIPCIVLWGDRSPYTQPDDAKRFGISRRVHFPQHGHWLPLDAPQEVADILLHFLRVDAVD